MVLRVLLLHPIIGKLLILGFGVGRRNYLGWTTAACCSLFGLIGAVADMIALILIAIGAQRSVIEPLASHGGSCAASEVVHERLLWSCAWSQATILLSTLGSHYVRI